MQISATRFLDLLEIDGLMGLLIPFVGVPEGMVVSATCDKINKVAPTASTFPLFVIARF